MPTSYNDPSISKFLGHLGTFLYNKKKIILRKCKGNETP